MNFGVKINLIITLSLLSQITSASIMGVNETHLEPVSHTDRRCAKDAKEYPFETEEILFKNTKFEISREVLVDEMVSELSKLRSIMIRNGDRVINSNRVLCSGVYNDGWRHNAFAMGHSAIKMGKGLILKIQRNYGDLADQLLQAILYHEFAHSIQSRHRWKYFEKDQNKRSKIKEMQADCMSAVFMKMQNVFDESTSEMFQKFAYLVGDRRDDGDHGTQSERFKALQHGANSYDKYVGSRYHMHSFFVLNRMCDQKDIKELITKRVRIPIEL